MLKDCGAEVPPPGDGLVTLTLTVAPVAISDAGMVAESCVALTSTVLSALPLKFTTELDTKFVPVTISVNPALPAITVGGERAVTPGAGLLTVNAVAAEVPPPGVGLVTVIFAVEAVATSAAVMLAVTCVELAKVVVLALPLKFTLDPFTKFVPFTVRVNAAAPAVTLEGERLATVGDGLLITKAAGAEPPAVGAGLVTTTFTLAATAMSAAGIVAVS